MGAAQGASALAELLALVADMSRDLAAAADLPAALGRALERIIAQVGAEGGTLFLLEDQGRRLRCHAAVGAAEIAGLVMPADKGIVGRCVRTNRGEIVRDVAADPAFFAEVDRQTGRTTRSIMCAPMSVKDERLGAIELVNKRGGDGRFAPTDLAVLEALSAAAGLAILNARMAAALVEQERMRRELELAAEIQRSLLPAEPPPGFPVRGINLPARTVSGDFFDFFVRADGRIAFSVGDVAGKGMNAALMMAKTAGLFRCLGKAAAPGRLLAALDAELAETATRGMFVTMVAGHFDPRRGSVVFANAGHEPPRLSARDGAITRFPAEAPPLGLGLGAGDFPETELRLDGGRLYVFTDGLTEGRRRDGGIMGADGVEAAIAAHAGRALGDGLAAIVASLDAEALVDDVTVLARVEVGAPAAAAGGATADGTRASPPAPAGGGGAAQGDPRRGARGGRGRRTRRRRGVGSGDRRR